MARQRPGDPAPEFSLPADTGSSISLNSLKGRRVVLYFYPKDDTPGCTKQACEYRDLAGQFDRRNTVVLGISGDDLKSHELFKRKYKLNFDAEIPKISRHASAYMESWRSFFRSDSSFKRPVL